MITIANEKSAKQSQFFSESKLKSVKHLSSISRDYEDTNKANFLEPTEELTGDAPRLVRLQMKRWGT